MKRTRKAAGVKKPAPPRISKRKITEAIQSVKKRFTRGDMVRLHTLAQRMLRERDGNPGRRELKNELEALLHELEVYQVELEIQQDELIQSQQSLQTLYHRFYELYDNAPIGYITLSREGKILEVNRFAVDLFERPVDRLKGTFLLQYIPRASHGEFLKQLRSLYTTNQTVTCDVRYENKNKEQRHYLFRISPTVNAREQVENYKVVIEDVTAAKENENLQAMYSIRLEQEVARKTQKLEQKNAALKKEVARRKETEAALKESESKFRTLVTSTDDIVYTLDAKQRHTGVFGRWLERRGMSPEMFIGRTAADLFGPEQAKIHSDANLRVLRGESVEYEWSMLIGAEVLHFHTSLAPLRNGSGIVQGIVGIGRNITARKRMEDELAVINDELEQRVRSRTAALQAAYDELESFSYSVSHDLRAPIRAIDSFTAILGQQYDHLFDTEAHRLMSVIRSSTKKMDLLINGLLTLSRVGRQELNMTTVNVAPMVGLVIEDLMHDQNHSRIKFIVHPLPSVLCDAVLMRQIWSNLISNAIKYSSKVGHAVIEIGMAETEEQYRFYVKDNGVGFSQEHADKLFGIFQRLHPHDQFEGIGIGLSTVKRIALRFGGTVWAEGSPEEGATFWFSIAKELPAQH
ncbi:MAG: PAS domain-containing protein [Bacteroidetes bacterium]|nr:PAS domain-containing protein [Bacteroidota bacterium]